MSHGIKEQDATFSVREMPWMGLLDGQVHVLTDYPTREEAQKIAHNWEPIPEPVYRRMPFINADGEPDVKYDQIAGFQANVRSDTSQTLGVTNDTLTLVSNNEMYDIAEALQGGDVSVKFETGGSLENGKKVWLMLKLDEPLEVKGDPHGAAIPFYSLQNNHDGGGAFRGQATTVRIVCANTSKMADLDAKARGTEFTFRHTSGITARVEEARLALAGWRESIYEWKLFNEFLLGEKVSPEGVLQFIEKFIPAPVSELTSERTKNNIEQARGEFMSVYNSVTCEGITGTAYGLLQASSEWSEHVRRAVTPETRFKRAVLKKNDVLTIAASLAQEAALV
jgi:phage/plasmid-like protein (TIGR03299 family)